MTDLTKPERHPDDPRDDILINRVVDGEATPADWAELDVVARRDPAIWARLAESQRSHASLQRAVEDTLTVAELVDLPHPAERLERAWDSRVRVWGGWMVAALVAIAWAGNFAQIRAMRAEQSGADPNANTAELAGLTSLSPDQLLQAYMQSGIENGRIVGEMPMVMLETVPTADGKSQITFVRPLVERAIVDQFYEMGQTDTGRLVPVEADHSEFTRGQPL